MTMRRILTFSVLAAFALMWCAALVDYGSLPTRFPTHFDAAGVPDGYGQKSAGAWFALPTLFSLMFLLFGSIAVYLPSAAAKHAKYINVPDKQAFLALSDEGRARALEPMRDLMLMVLVPLGLMAAYIEHGSWLVAVGGARTLSAWPVPLVLVCAVASLAVAVFRTKRAIAAERAAG